MPFRTTWRALAGIAGGVAFAALLLLASEQFRSAAAPLPDVLGTVEEAQSVVGDDGVATSVAESGQVASTIPPTTTEAPPQQRRSVVAFTGDILAHRGVVRQAASYGVLTGQSYNFGPMFDSVAPYLSEADLAICHLETPLSADNLGLSGFPTFNVPREMAEALAGAGYDGCSTASNHSLDQGRVGVFETLDVLEEAGVVATGTARNEQERNTPIVFDAGGISVATLSYTFGFNGFRRPSDMWWIANPIEVEQIRVDAERVRAAGAEVVIVSLHWGVENQHEITPDQRAVATELADLGLIDVIVGHHAHVVQPVDTVNGLVVAYGIGNFLSNQSAACCAAGSQDGMILQVVIEEELEEAATSENPTFNVSVEYVPTWVDRTDYTIVSVNDVLASDEVGETVRTTLETSRARTHDVVTSLEPEITIRELVG